MARELGVATRQPAEGQRDAKLPVGREVAVEESVEVGIVRIAMLVGRRIIVNSIQGSFHRSIQTASARGVQETNDLRVAVPARDVDRARSVDEPHTIGARSFVEEALGRGGVSDSAGSDEILNIV